MSLIEIRTDDFGPGVVQSWIRQCTLLLTAAVWMAGCAEQPSQSHLLPTGQYSGDLPGRLELYAREPVSISCTGSTSPSAGASSYALESHGVLLDSEGPNHVSC